MDALRNKFSNFFTINENLYVSITFLISLKPFFFMSEKADILNHLLWATKKINDLLVAVSEDEFNKKPSLKTRSIKEIVLHLVSINAYFSSFNEYKAIVETSKQMNKDDLLELYRDLTKKVYEIFQKDPEKFIPIKTKNITGFSLIHMYADHFSYHRGQILTAFKLVTGKEGIGTDFAIFLQENEPDFIL